MKDLGRLKYFQGIAVVYSKEGIFLSQRKYILDLLKDTGIVGSKPASQIPRLRKRKGDGIEDKRKIPKISWKVDIFVAHQTGYNICSDC